MSTHVSGASPKPHRKPWQAAVLSLLLPGLGQIHNGELTKGIVFFCLLWAVVIVGLVIGMELSLPPFNVAVPVLIVLSVYLCIAVDAIRVARLQGDAFARKSYNRWYFYLMAWLACVFVAQPALNQIMRHVVMQAFRVSSGAMEGTLLIGDHILVNRFLYRSTDPKQFDIIIFQHPWDEDLDFIKRVVALPGDQVDVRDQQVYVNDEALRQEWYLNQTAPLGHDNFGPVVVPRAGDTAEIRQDQNLYLNGERMPIPLGMFFPSKHGQAMDGFQVFYGPLFPPGTTLRQPIGPRVVENDYYFTLGDNRGNSRDSRFWGFVADPQILGIAKRIYWSWDQKTGRVRWERIGQSVNSP